MAFRGHSMSELHAHRERQKRSGWRRERSDAELDALKLLLRKRLDKLKSNPNKERKQNLSDK